MLPLILPPYISTPTFQYSRPSADYADGNWYNELGTQTNLYASVDETTASDSDYIYTMSTGSPVTLTFGSLTDPSRHDNHTFKYRLKGDGVHDCQITMYSGDTQIAQWTETNPAATWTTYQHTISESEAANIANYGTPRFKFDAIDGSIIYLALPASVQRKRPTGLRFDGSGSGEWADFDMYGLTLSDYSIVVWAKLNSNRGDYSTIVSADEVAINSVGNYDINSLQTDEDGVTVGWYVAPSYVNPRVWTVGEWGYAVFTYQASPGIATCYNCPLLDGPIYSANTGSGYYPPNSVQHINLAQNGYENDERGDITIGGLIVYQGVLTAAQVKRQKEQLTPIKPAFFWLPCNNPVAPLRDMSEWHWDTYGSVQGTPSIVMDGPIMPTRRTRGKHLISGTVSSSAGFFIRTPNRWNRHPEYAVQINQAHPLAEYLYAAVLFNAQQRFVEVVRNILPSYSSVTNFTGFKPNVNGSGATASGTGLQVVWTFPQALTTPNATVLAGYRYNTRSDYNAVWKVGSSVAGCGFGTTDSAQDRIRGYDNSPTEDYFSALSVTYPYEARPACTFRAGVPQKPYFWGKENTFSGTFTGANNIDRIVLGCQVNEGGSGSAAYNSGVASRFCMVFKQEFSADVIRELSYEPYGLFIPRISRTYSFSG